MDGTYRSPTKLRFGDFEVDLRSGELRHAGIRIKLQEQPLKILIVLLEHPGELVTREELRRRIWPTEAFGDFDHAVNIAVGKLRTALGDSAGTPRIIETLPRRGYRLIVAVTAAAEGPRKTKRSILYMAAIMLVCVLLALMTVFFYRRNQLHMLDASNWVKLTNFTDSATSPALSRDGRMLTFIRGTDTFAGPGQVYVKLLPDGEPVQLTHDSLLKMSPVFSSNGARIAYSVAIKWDTWEVPTMGGESRLVLANASGLTWTDDGHVVFSEIKGGRHMGVVESTENRTDVRSVYLPQDEDGMAHRSSISPDGHWLLVAEMNGVRGWLPCRVLPFDGTSSGNSIGVPGTHCTSVAWSPDGRRMYFSSDSGGSFHIWRQRFPKGKPEQVTFGPNQEDGIAMAPDGRSFITSVGMAESTVWVHDLKGESQITSEGYAEEPLFSSDGTKLFFLMRLKGQGYASAGKSAGAFPNDELWVADLGNNRAEPLLPNFPVTGYTVAPDGQRLVCSVLDVTGKSHLWLAYMDRHAPPEQIASASSESQDFPNFASNGDLFFRGASGVWKYLYRIKRGETTPEKLTKDAIVEPQSVSPDGRWVTTQVARPEPDAPRGVVAYPVEGGIPIRVCRGLCFIKWTLDGRFVSILLPGTGEMSLGRTFLIPVKPGNPFSWVPHSGIQSESDLLTLPGIKIVQGAITPGADVTRYAFAKYSVHMNLYRIPIL